MTTEGLTPGQRAQVACLLEVTARKPGNVHRHCDFADSHYLDFLLSASAIAAPLDRARVLGIGATVLQAIAATQRVVATNTNLGMVLLLVPLAAVPDGVDLRGGLVRVLSDTTINDARLVYEAIRLARPGGLGDASEQDVAREPTVPLWAAMQLASSRDLIARQYANGYADVFQVGLPALRAALAAGRPLETAIVAAQLALLASTPDSLILRKRGLPEAVEALRQAARVLAAGWPDDPAGMELARAFDAWLRAHGHSRNPGATADLVSAALYAALHDGTIALPFPADPAAWSAVDTA